MKGKRLLIASLIFVWAITALYTYKSTKKLTYLEYLQLNEDYGDMVEPQNAGEYFEQPFQSPYDMLHGVAIKINTHDRDNNSIWNVALLDGATKEVLYEKDYNASLIENDTLHLFEFDKKIKVKKGETYIVRVTAKTLYDLTNIAFYMGESTDLVGRHTDLPGMNINGKETTKSLCFSVYGGDFDLWWPIYTVLIGVLVSLFLIRIWAVSSKDKRITEDTLVGSMAVFFMVLLLLNSFAVAGGFLDEWDNIRGGMIIGHGGVLYRDYVAQHTPVMYYLCSLFAKLGAGSLEQFRLSYYFFEALVWAGLFARHKDFFGKKKMIALVAFECIFVSSVLGATEEGAGYMILSDGMQGLCMVALLLEFLRYVKDKKIGWDRAVVISLCFWGSFGAAFISAYAMVFVVLSVFGLEVYQIIKEKPSVLDLVKRYYKLLICMVIPPIIGAAYFAANHALKRAIEQFYAFNRVVYSEYYTLGDKFYEPFVTSAQNFFGVIADKFNLILAASATNADILQLVIATVATASVVALCVKKQYVEGLTVLAVMVFSASRGYDFHGIAAWYVAIMIVILFGKDLYEACTKRIAVPVVAIAGIFLFSIYATTVGTNLLHEQEPVSELGSRVASITQDGEEIFVDAIWCEEESVYLCHKNRYPANRACYMLAWYMDWYENEEIQDLCEKRPNIVLYKPDEMVWGYQYVTNAFADELVKGYAQFSGLPIDGWKYIVWVKKGE